MELSEKDIRALKKRIEAEVLKKEAEIIEFWKRDIERVYKKSLDPKYGVGELQQEMKTILDRMTNRLGIVSKLIKELS